MPTPSSSAAPSALLLSVSSHTSPERRTKLSASTAKASSFCSVTCPSSTVPVTMCSWLRCSPERQLWTPLCFWSQETNLAHSPRPPSTWRLWRSWTWTKLLFFKTKSILSSKILTRASSSRKTLRSLSTVPLPRAHLSSLSPPSSATTLRQS